jgi:type IV pilus assembly protein PilY1
MQSGMFKAAFKRLGDFALSAVLGLGAANAIGQTVDLADKPLFSTNNVPGNLLLALSVEWPTANTPAYLSTSPYSTSTKYLGYFDNGKCYQYNHNSTAASLSYFSAAGSATSAACTSTTAAHRWSGNYLNWAAMQSLDIFRWALTGGDRAVDSTTETILEKTRHSGQGSRTTLYPDKTLSVDVSGASPFTSASLGSRVHGMGTFVQFSPATALVSCSINVNSNRRVTFTCTPSGGSATSCNTGDSNPATGGTAACTQALSNGLAVTCTASRPSSDTYNATCVGGSSSISVAAQTCSASNLNYSSNAANGSCTSAFDVADYTGSGTLLAGRRYNVQMRVKACDSAGGLESNCKAYGSNYKPEGLMQEYSMQLRFGAFGYLNDDNILRDGGVLRAQLGSIGPQSPVPGSTPVTNAQAEWSATTGQLVTLTPPRPARLLQTRRRPALRSP